MELILLKLILELWETRNWIQSTKRSINTIMNIYRGWGFARDSKHLEDYLYCTARICLNIQAAYFLLLGSQLWATQSWKICKSSIVGQSVMRKLCSFAKWSRQMKHSCTEMSSRSAAAQSSGRTLSRFWKGIPDESSSGSSWNIYGHSKTLGNIHVETQFSYTTGWKHCVLAHWIL